MGLTLHDLTGSYKQLEALAEDGDDNVIVAALRTIEGAIEEKTENIVKLIKNQLAEAEALKAEADRLTKRQKAIEHGVARLKEYAKLELDKVGMDKLKVGIFSVAIQNSTPTVIISDAASIPAEFITIVPEQHIPDKKRLIEALKAGREVPGAELKQGRHLRIR